MPTHAYRPMVRIGIQRWKPCRNVQAAVPATPMTGVSDRKRMFTQSFFCELMTTPPRLFRTGIAVMVFAAAVARGQTASQHYRAARDYMSEAKRTSNAIRLAYIGWQIGEELEQAVALDPTLIDARLDLVRFYVVAPRIVGGSMRKARDEASEIAKRDAALGAFASGYIAYREKAYGPARIKLRDAVRLAKTPQTKTLALTWLGWLSQETQQYDAAFDAWSEVMAIDPSRV